MRHLNTRFDPGDGNFNNPNFKVQMPGGLPGGLPGGMLKFPFDRYITCTVFMDKTKSKVYCFLQSKYSIYFNKIMKSKHMLWEYRILFLSKFLQICMKFDCPVY